MVLLDCGERPSLGDLYLLELAKGIEEALVARGMGPVINATRETLTRLVSGQGVAGVVLAVGAERHALAREFASMGIPCVVIDQAEPAESLGVGWVVLNLESGARDAARALVDHGHSKISFIGNAEDDYVLSAFSDELKALGSPLNPESVVIAGMGRAAGAAAMRELMLLTDRPTAVFARTDVLAMGALGAAADLGIRVPEEVSILGHDDITLAGAMDLSTVRIDCRALGKAAAEILERLQRGFANEPPAVLRTELILRKTTGPAS